MAICARCGAESPEGFRFCGACGAPLEKAAPRRQARKVVTALFCDVTCSTALGEELDPEVLRGVMNRYFEEMRAVIERHGGTVEKFIGDAVMAVFGIPRVHEDDARRAVTAAAGIRERLPAVAAEVGVALRLRTGVNTGPVLMGEGENLAIGDAINVAARLEQAAEPGEIMIGPETLRLVRDAVTVEQLEPLELKGKSEPVPAYRLLSVNPAAEGFARHLDVPMVGRQDELRVLREAWERVIRESGCHLFTLLGAAGVGKSRLVEELLSTAGGRAIVLRGRCLHYGEGITFWPLVEALMPLGEPAQQVIDRLTTGSTAIAEELFWDVRRLLEGLARERPVLFHLDDLQWAEPTLLDLLDHVADLSRGAPILLLCTARPELLEDRSGWAGGKLNATTLLLEPLGEADSEALLDELGDSLDPEARRRVIAASEGNPLFLEEMVALAQDRGTVEVSPTIQALLAARLERLGEESVSCWSAARSRARCSIASRSKRWRASGWRRRLSCGSPA
jgi:class 3 adenylate cyclase